MHASSIENMEKCYRRFVEGGPLEQQDLVQLLDVGGADVNGSYREIFRHPRFAYTGVDIAPGPGVHLVLDDPYRIPLADRSVDIVMSGQMLEHCEFFWLTFTEMMRVLKPGGYLFLIAPSGGPEHRYPVDCYRFYPDAYRALARYANCQLIDVWRDERGPWRDLVGVFQHHNAPTAAEPLPEQQAVHPSMIVPGTDAEELLKGERPYLEILDELHDSLKPQNYIEIGVRHGNSLRLARGPAIGIDPAPELAVTLPQSTRVFTQTSDDFFQQSALAALTSPIDFAFIDGLHVFEAALRDFMHIERLASPDGIIVVDDIAPNHPAQAERERRTRAWTGDVWKIVPLLQRYRPDLVLVQLDTAPSGLLLIGGLDPVNQVLWDQYNPLVREAREWGGPPDALLRRHGMVAPGSSAWRRFVLALSRGEQRAAALRTLASEGTQR